MAHFNARQVGGKRFAAAPARAHRARRRQRLRFHGLVLFCNEPGGEHFGLVEQLALPRILLGAGTKQSLAA